MSRSACLLLVSLGSCNPADDPAPRGGDLTTQAKADGEPASQEWAFGVVDPDQPLFFHWRDIGTFDPDGASRIVVTTLYPHTVTCWIAETFASGDLDSAEFSRAADGNVALYGPRTDAGWAFSSLLGWGNSTASTSAPLAQPGDYLINVFTLDGATGFWVDCWLSALTDGVGCADAEARPNASGVVFHGYFNSGRRVPCGAGRLCDPYQCGATGPCCQ
jgi:hypothetical protein